MLFKCYGSTEVDSRTWQHVPSGTLWSTSNDTREVVENKETSTKILNIGLLIEEKKEESWLSPMTKAQTRSEKSKKQRDNPKTPRKLRLHNDCGPTYKCRTVSWRYNSHQTGVVKPIYVIPTFPLTTKAV